MTTPSRPAAVRRPSDIAAHNARPAAVRTLTGTGATTVVSAEHRA